MVILTVVIFIIICIVIFYFSPVIEIMDDVHSKYSICKFYAKVEVTNKDISVLYNRLIFKISTQLQDTTIISEVTPKDFNNLHIGDIVYIFLSDDGRRICDICQTEELDARLKMLSSFPLQVNIKEMEGC